MGRLKFELESPSPENVKMLRTCPVQTGMEGRKINGKAE